MEIKIETNTYNEKRYGRPWIARVDFSQNPKGNFAFGTWVGEPGYKGILLLDAEPGDIVAKGQKDYRKPANSTPCFYFVKENGELERLGTKGVAYKYWRKQNSDNKKIENLKAEKEKLLARIEEIDKLLGGNL